MERRTITILTVLLMATAFLLPSGLAHDPDDDLPKSDTLPPCATITGTVSDGDGDPVQHIRVTAVAQNSGAASQVYDYDFTNDAGHYTLSVRAGTWLVSAQDGSDAAQKTVAIGCEEEKTADLTLGEGSDPDPEPEGPHGTLAFTLHEHLGEVGEEPRVGIPDESIVAYEDSCPEKPLAQTPRLPLPAAGTNTTDENGFATIKLEPGIYCVLIELDHSDDYDTDTVDTVTDIEIKDGETTEASSEGYKKVAERVNLRARDFDTGEFLSGVAFTFTDERYCPDGKAPDDSTYDCDGAEAGRNPTMYADTMPQDSGTAYTLVADHEFYHTGSQSCSVRESNNALNCLATLARASGVITVDDITSGPADVAFLGLDKVDQKSLTGTSGFTQPLKSDDYNVRMTAGGITHNYCASLSEDETQALGTLDLSAAQHTIAGHVVDGNASDLAPVEGALVMFTDATDDMCYTYTDDQGGFNMSLADGVYDIAVAQDGFQTNTTYVNATNVTVSNTVDLSGGPIELGEIRLARALATVTGEIEEDVNGGEYVGDLDVRCTNPLISRVFNGTTSDEGATSNYEVRIPAGDGWTCNVSDPAGVFYPASFDEPFDVSPGGTHTESIDVIRKIWTVSGIATDQTGEPLEGVFVSAMNAETKVTARDTTDVDGMWSINLTYDLNTDLAEHGEMNSIVLDGQKAGYGSALNVTGIGPAHRPQFESLEHLVLVFGGHCSGSDDPEELVLGIVGDTDCDGDSNDRELKEGCNPLDPESNRESGCDDEGGLPAKTGNNCIDDDFDPVYYLTERLLDDADCDGRSNDREIDEETDPFISDPDE